MRWLVVPVSLLLAAAAVAAFGGPEDVPTRVEVLTVLAATSLKVPFTEFARAFERAHTGVDVQVSFGPSDKFATQIAGGLDADVVATASRVHIDQVEREAGAAGATAFAGNELVIAASKSSARRISEPRDLAAAGVRVSVGDADVPVGRYAAESLSLMSKRFGGRFATAVEGNVVNRGSSAADVITPVSLGGADASISYATDAAGTGGRVRVVEVPDWAQPQISYWIATRGPSRAAAQFADLVGSESGAATLRAAGFVAPLGEGTGS